MRELKRQRIRRKQNQSVKGRERERERVGRTGKGGKQNCEENKRT